MWNISRRNLLITLVFSLWLGAAALACGVFSSYRHPMDPDDLLLGAPAEASSPTPTGPVVPVALKSFR